MINFNSGFFMRNDKKENEQGIALLFTLGILSLLLVLALSFATTTSVDKKLAEVNNDVTSARFIADSALERICGTFRFVTNTNAADYDLSAPPYTPVAYSSGSGVNDNLVSSLTTIQDGTTLLEAGDIPSDAEWALIHEDCDTSKRVIGRIGYVVYGAGGKLTPQACIEKGQTAIETDVVRPGQNVYEINIGNLELQGKTSFLNSYLSKFNKWDETYDNSDATKTGPDWDTFFTELGVTDENQKDIMKTDWFVEPCAGVLETEDFWKDNGDGIDDATEHYARFNLMRNDWNTLTVDKLLGLGASDPASSLKPANSNTQEDVLWWLANYDAGGLPKGDFTDAKTRAKQIAANIIDYCDTDTKATTDGNVSGSVWSTKPTYLGLEKVPLIYRISTKVDAKVHKATDAEGSDDHISSNPNPDTDYLITGMTLEMKLYLANMFGLTKEEKQDFKVRVSLKFSYDYLDTGNVWETVDEDFTGAEAKEDTLEDIDNNFSGTLTSIVFTSHKFPSTVILNPRDSTENKYAFRNFRVKELEVYLYNKNGEIVDYSDITDSTDLTTNGVTQFCERTDGMSRYGVFEVEDPRQNLFSTDWTYKDSWDPEGELDSNAPNPISHPENGDDKEDYDIINISTAYIRNAPMESPWELGFIHRGAKWQTINLHSWSDETHPGTGGIGEYAKGDANILDEIKMKDPNLAENSDDFKKTLGKVNLNTKNEDVINAILGGITKGETPHTLKSSDPVWGPGEGGTILTSSEVDSLVTSINSSMGISSRSEIVGKAPTITVGDTDAAQEEIVGKFINLTKGGSSVDRFDVIIVAQSIRDVGGSGGNEVTITYMDDHGAYQDVQAAIGRFDVGADEVLSEQKVKATIARRLKTDSSGNSRWEWQIVDYEYLED